MTHNHSRFGALAVCLLAFVVGLPSPAAAQLDRPTAQVLIGATITTVSFEDAGNLGIDWRAGFVAGVGVPIPLGGSQKVAFRPEAQFVQKGAVIHGSFGEERIRTSYVGAALGLELDVLPALANDGHVRLLVAPTLNWNVQASRDLNGDKTDIKEFVNTFEAGLQFGATVPVVKDKLDVGARYEIGLTHLFKQSANNARNQSLLIFVTPHLFKG